MIRSRAMVRPLSVCLALAVIGCNDHRYGFFGDEEGSGGGTDTTTGREPTTLSPTTVSPTTVPDPTVPDPTVPDPTIGPTTGPDPSGPITITSEPTTSDPTSDTTSGPVCGEELPSTVPLAVSGNNAGMPDLFHAPCVDGFGGDSVWLWTAPFEGVFEINTIGSNFDTVLTVFEGLCGGPVLECNDDSLQLWSRVTVKLAGGTPLTISVEGLGAQTGSIELNILEAVASSCDAVDLGASLGLFGGSTLGMPDMAGSACGGGGSPDTVFVWQPPFAGEFVFRTAGSDFDPVLYVRRGSCEGEELACNDDFDTTESQVQLFLLPEDGPVFIFVDGALGGGGNFFLEIFE